MNAKKKVKVCDSKQTRAGSERDALRSALAVCPVWQGMGVAHEAIGLERNTILHAGPPYADLSAVPAPVRNSVLVAAVFEGWAEDFSVAAEQYEAGMFCLRPAQNYGVVTPLAAVVSPSMSVQIVADRNGQGPSVAAPLNGGIGPAMRYGQCNGGVLDRIRWLNSALAPVLDAALTAPIELVPLADHGLHRGDDCHGRTAEATGRLIKLLRQRLHERLISSAAEEFLKCSPGFFLNLWMAACKCMLGAVDAANGASLVTGMGGNGVEMGVQVAGLVGRWFTVSAVPPKGCLKSGFHADDGLGAIGDSAVVEAFGLGAMSWHPFESAALTELEPFLPADAAQRSTHLLLDEHRGFSPRYPKVGISARDVASCAMGPIVSLGIVHKDGIEGLLGPGIYDVPVEPFIAAVNAIDAG